MYLSAVDKSIDHFWLFFERSDTQILAFYHDIIGHENVNVKAIFIYWHLLTGMTLNLDLSRNITHLLKDLG